MNASKRKAREKNLERFLEDTCKLMEGIPIDALKGAHAAIMATMLMARFNDDEALSIKHLEHFYHIMGIDITWPNRNDGEIEF